jgi:NO-binding membrane sensor protein with MHYT domain
MHYTGMLAFRLPVPDTVGRAHCATGVRDAFFAAFFATFVALFVMRDSGWDRVRAFVGSLFMGAGISGLHYIAMASMPLPRCITTPRRSWLFRSSLPSGSRFCRCDCRSSSGAATKA